VSLSGQPRSKKIKFTSISGNLRKVPSNPSVRGLSREVTARRLAGCAEAVSLGTSRHETASFAPIGSLRSEEASCDSLAKIISTNVSVQFLRRLGNQRVGVARGARVHRSARVRVESGLAGRAGTSFGYPSAISLFLPINMAHLRAGAARMRGAVIERIVCPGPSRMGVCGLKVSKFPWTG
jgi:hypothetical protein